MYIDFEITDSILIVKMTGEIDHHKSADIRGEIDGAYTAFSCTHLVLDFSKVSFVDSSGIGVIMGRYNKVKEKGGKLVICGCSDSMRNILFMAGIFTIVDEVNDAPAAIQMIKESEDAAQNTGGDESGK